MKCWLKPHEKGTTVALYILPGAPKTHISGEHDGRLKIKVKGPPVDGAANESLMNFLSDYLRLAKSKIHLIQGESSRQKLILVELPLDKVSELFQF